MGEGTGSVGGWGGYMDFYPSHIQTNAIILIFKNVLSPAEVYARLVLLKSVKISHNWQCLHDIFRRCSTNWHVWHWKRTERTVPQSLQWIPRHRMGTARRHALKSNTTNARQGAVLKKYCCCPMVLLYSFVVWGIRTSLNPHCKL